jgi:hypothetical protein
VLFALNHALQRTASPPSVRPSREVVSAPCAPPAPPRPSLTFVVRFPNQDHQDSHRRPITPDPSDTLGQPDMTTIQRETAIPSGNGHAPLAWESLAGVPLILIELSGPANGRQAARRVAMRTLPVAGTRR